MIKYSLPQNWLSYNLTEITAAMVEAKAVVLSLRTVPYQRSWIDALQQLELKREVAGTSRIEGAEFTDRELDAALKETPEQLLTRSQRQAHAAVQTYRWIATIPDDRPISQELICEIHRRIVTGADDDHCPPGKIRSQDENVNFGSPRHRGAEGGSECATAFASLGEAIQHQFRDHDPLIQALAAHYHFASMHPFLDGNGRTARALEAMMFRRAGLRDTCFISMSNYYYEEKTAYLRSLAEVRATGHDLTPFLKFGLRGVALQSQRVLREIQHEISKEIFRNLMYSLFTRLKTPKRRVMAERKISVLKLLLDHEWRLGELRSRLNGEYRSLNNPSKALVRDLNELIQLRAVSAEKLPDNDYLLKVRLEWPTEITETEFFQKVKKLPKAKTHGFLQ